MLICDYIVESIDGDYAHLRRTAVSYPHLCERSPAVLHALNGSAVYGKQTKNEIKWCHNCEIHIGIMIYFLCWIRQKHPHDRMAKDENSNTHKQVKSFCLNQAGAYSLTDSVLPVSYTHL